METANFISHVVTTAVKKYLPANEKRTCLIIKNNSAQILYIGSKADDKTGNMYPLAAAGVYTNEHNQGEVYLACDANTADTRIEEDACE